MHQIKNKFYHTISGATTLQELIDEVNRLELDPKDCKFEFSTDYTESLVNPYTVVKLICET